MTNYRVLVSDEISPSGLAMLEETAGIEVVNKPSLPKDGVEALRAELLQSDAVLIRSGTKLTPEVLDGQERLKLVVRAGVGVDNVNLPAATKNGVIVMNTPDGNTISTAEHTVAMMMALSRNIGPASASMRAGNWDRKKFTGTQLSGKTLGIIGMGRIGQEVAKRAQAFEMNVIGSDLILSSERAADLGIELVRDVKELISRCDYITLHTPKTPETTGMINAESLAAMKPGARVINCARGGIVDEDALADAIESGHIAGAALDVFSTEPPGETRLTKLPQVLCTPHLGASTNEAQELVAVEAAELVKAFLIHGEIRNPVNTAPLLAAELSKLRIGFDLTYRLGRIAAAVMKQRCLSGVQSVSLTFRGENLETKVEPLTNYFLASMLDDLLDEPLNYVNAREVAVNRGIKIQGAPDTAPGDFSTLVSVRVVTDQCEVQLAGSVLGKRFLRLVRLDDLPLDAYLDGVLLIYRHQDRPGLIGAIGTTLGEHNVNIADMSLGREKRGGESVAVLNLDDELSDEVLKKVREHAGVTAVEVVSLPPADAPLPWLPSAGS